MTYSFVHHLLAAAVLLGSGALAAQETRTQPGTLPDSHSGEAARTVPAAGTTTAITPLSLRGKFHYRLRHSIEPIEMVRLGIGAGLDQWRRYPDEWGEGWDAYGVRFASVFGQHLAKEQIMFAVEALDHEDPRRPRVAASTLKGRMLNAVKYTYIARSDNGNLMPAYSRFVGAFGSAAVSRYGWYPREYHTVRTVIDVGLGSLAIDAGMNVLRELFHSVH